MIWVLLTSILWSSVSGISEYHRMKDRMVHNEYDSQQWHKLEFLDASLAIGTGVAITLDAVSEESIWIGVADLLVTSAVRWNFRDGSYNLKNGNSFYYQSPNTMSGIESFGTPVIKLGYLIAALIFRLLI